MVDGRVVAPRLRIADLVAEGVQLLLRFDLGGVAHPVQLLDVLIERGLERMD